MIAIRRPPCLAVQVAQREHMGAVFAFLGLRNLTEPEWTKVGGVTATELNGLVPHRYTISFLQVMGMPVKNVGKGKSEMLPETRRVLEAFYAPFNAELARQLGDERYLWKPAAASSAA